MSNWQQRFTYSVNGTWLKGNTHTHTTASDGGLEVPEIAELYASADFDFVFITDHMAPSKEQQSGNTYPLQVFDGVEIHGVDGRGGFYHVICLGSFTGISADMEFEAALSRCREQDAVVILAHPAWTGNTVEETLAHEFHCVEIYNNICRKLNGKGTALVHWDRLLEEHRTVFGISCDDAHLTQRLPAWNGGWIMVNAEACSSQAVLAAIRSGNFYSTQGPSIHTMEATEDNLSVTGSPIQYARLVGRRSQGFPFCVAADDNGMTSYQLPLLEKFDYLRLEIEDINGKRAWTNVLFSD